MILSIIHATIPFTSSSVPVNVGNAELRKIPHFNVWTGNLQDVEKDVEMDEESCDIVIEKMDEEPSKKKR